MRLVVKEYEVPLVNGHTEKTIGIGMLDDYGIVFPSPLSNLIKSEYANNGKALNSQRNAAYAITRFFNHIYKNINKPFYNNLKLKGLKGLTLEHGAAYITELSLHSRAGEKSGEYVKSDIDYISNFYFWLKKQNITEENYQIKEREHSHNKYKKTRKKIRENVFETNDMDMIYPNNGRITTGKIKTFGKNRDKLIARFINVARRVDKEIALGIALQILAGLRRSEAINLLPSSFIWENKSLVLKIRDNQEKLFPNALNTTDIQVKNPRDQIVLCSDIIQVLFDEHVTNLSKMKKSTNEAFFISSETKNAITGKAFSTRFEKVKEVFLQEILESGNQEDYLLLTSNAWSTHIGRGIFTNILLDLGLSATQIALARGDRNINSALHYVDENIMLYSVQDAINHFRILL